MEAEVLPLFVCGAVIVLALELLLGGFILQEKRAAQFFLTLHVLSMGGALYFLIRCVFALQLHNRFGLPLTDGSVEMGLFGVLWAVSVGLLLAVFHFARKDKNYLQ